MNEVKDDERSDSELNHDDMDTDHSNHGLVDRDNGNNKEQLRRSEEMFRLLVDSVHDHAIFMIDTTGNITTWNIGAERILGYRPEEILGKNFSAIFTPEDQREGVPEHELFEAAEKGHEQDTRWHVRKDGSRFWADGVVTPVYDEQGKLRGYGKVLQDFTERKKAEDDLANAYERERRVADILQRSLLLTPSEDAFPGLTVAPLYQPASDEALVGGDFYDIFALDEGRVALMIGDVSGKGLVAAARTAEIKFSARAFLREYPHAARTLDRLNAVLFASMRLDQHNSGTPHLDEVLSESFICLTVMTIKPSTGEAVVSVASMEPPLIIRANGSAEEVHASGMPLGTVPRTEYGAATFTLANEDLLILTTDGVTDARRGREFFGYDGIKRIVRQARTLSPRLIGQSILDGARAFAGKSLTDDACLLLARLK